MNADYKKRVEISRKLNESKEFYQLVREEYFKSRDKEDWIKSNELEKQVDELLKKTEEG